MDRTQGYPSDVAFTPTVKALQTREVRAGPMREWRKEARGRRASRPILQNSSRRRPASSSPPPTRRASPTSNAAAAPPGFLRVLDDQTIGFADFTGNRQYITLGNLADNPKAHLFLIHYAQRRRVKIWGKARVVEGEGTPAATLMPRGTRRVPSKRSSLRFPPGTRIAASTFPSDSTPPKLPLRSRSAISASRRWKPSDVQMGVGMWNRRRNRR